MDFIYSIFVKHALEKAHKEAKLRRHEFVTPEHLLLAMLQQEEFLSSIDEVGENAEAIKKEINDFISNNFEKVPEDINYEPTNSEQTQEILINSEFSCYFTSSLEIDVPNVFQSMLNLKDSWGMYLFKNILGESLSDFIMYMIDEYNFSFENFKEPRDLDELDTDDVLPDLPNNSQQWKSMLSSITDKVETHNRLIGRDDDLCKIIQTLCRKQKNNPLLIGEPGVGKTEIIYGLAEKISNNDVPDKLKGFNIYEMNIGALIAGTQYRGEFEKKLRTIMSGVEEEGNIIIFIDEIHNIIGAGGTSDGSIDASNILKPYLDEGKIKFIGATTYDDYNKYFINSKGMVRRFNKIDILEPSVEECVNIIKGLQTNFEKFHNVKYENGVIEYAVKASDKYIKDKFLPDKAIDLIDEAGAYLQIQQKKNPHTIKKVTKDTISEILSKVCNVEYISMNEDNSKIQDLDKRMLAKIYGQDEAIEKVTEAIMMSRAGFNDDNKPIASLLFVGPTGVGKTEIAKVLASELGINLIRFDMSEYSEKHTVAKLIGSPAGYVGYEEGGLLTDAIRKSPNCVLLLDEIEKAHPDIFNILLQVMDYAVLTDNKGKKSDCRHLIIIMTSNAGAQYANRSSIGFSGTSNAKGAILKEVKKTFKPEFINRLSSTIVFNEMSTDMAMLILEKKLGEFIFKVNAHNVKVKISNEAKEWLLKKCFTKEYGAREIDRTIAKFLKPILVKEVLFGKLKKGGNAFIEIKDNELSLMIKKA